MERNCDNRVVCSSERLGGTRNCATGSRESSLNLNGSQDRAHDAKTPGPSPVLPSGEAVSSSAMSLSLTWRRVRVLVPLAVLCVLAVLFIAWEVALRRFIPETSVGWHHVLLTVWAGIVTAFTCYIVYFLMRRHHQQLSKTAEEIGRLLESYQARGSTSSRFENPHLAYCRDVLHCERQECPMFNARGDRCWQTIALHNGSHEHGGPKIEINQCHECDVYKRSCPDKLTHLGESFNNLMFLLEEEAQQVGLMRAQMLEKEKMVAIGQMAAGVAHEVGNPLSSISSIVQLAKRGKSSGPIRSQLDLIETHIQRITTTVRQLVSLARPGEEKWEQTDIDQMVAEAVELISFDRKARDVKISFEKSENLPLTYALRAELQQVVINLGLNSISAMPNGGRLDVRAKKAKDRRTIQIEVEDTGLGIPSGIGRRIFEPFFTTKEPGQGTGLGLSVSYGIIQKHGGIIEFDSTEGKGTVFTVQLPILNRPPETDHGSTNHTTGR